MRLRIQLHLAGLSLSNTVSVLEVFGVERARSTLHNWVQKAERQPEHGHTLDHVAVDATVIQRNDERYLLYAAVDPEPNEIPYTALEPTRNAVIAHLFLRERHEKHAGDDAVILVDGSPFLQAACNRHGLRFRYEKYGNRNAVERIFREIKQGI